MRVEEIVAQVLRQPPAAVTDETSNRTVAGWDSLRHIELIMALEDAYGVAFTPAQVVTMTSVGAIRQFLTEKGVAA